MRKWPLFIGQEFWMIWQRYHWRKLATWLRGKMESFAFNAKVTFLTMVKFFSLIQSLLNHSQLIFISYNLPLSDDKASRRRSCKKWLVILKCELEIHGFGALCFKIKSIARQNVFASSWTFFESFVTRATTFMFWVFSDSKRIYVKNGHESDEKLCFLTLENFSKC